MPRTLLILLALLLATLPACSAPTPPAGPKTAATNALWSAHPTAANPIAPTKPSTPTSSTSSASSLTPPTPTAAPDDFWIGITILGPVRSGGADGVSAYDALPRPLRPGRYVVEPDRGLHAALGVGAKQSYFPPLTRRLTAPEFAELWHAADAAGLLDPKHPNIASGNGEIDPETIQGKTIYVIDAHAGGRREMVIMEVDPDCGEWGAKAKGVVDWMAGKAWVKPAAPGPTEGK